MSIKLDSRFTEWLRARLPDATNVRISDVKTPSAGLSAETLIFTLHYSGPEIKSERLVLRSDPRGRKLFPAYDLKLQYEVMRALQRTSLPVPKARWHEPDAAVIGTPFIVMEYVEGNVPSDIPPGFHGQGLFFAATEAERAAMWNSGIEQMAALHALDWRALALPDLPGTAADVKGAIEGQGRLLESWISWGRIEDLELIQHGMRWLKQTPIPTERLSLLWGDARPGNILYRNGSAAALLDWEIASIGVPEFDLFFWWWSSEMLAEVNGIPRLEGLPDKESTIGIYEKAAGRSIAEVADYAETFTVLRLAIMIALGIRATVTERYTDDFLFNNGPARALQARLSASR